MSIQLMSEVFKSQELSSNEKLVMLAICDCANDEGLCWPSLRKLSEKTCLSETGISRIINRLTGTWLTKKKRFGRSTIYTVSTLSQNCTKVETVSTEEQDSFNRGSKEKHNININKESSLDSTNKKAYDLYNCLAKKVGLPVAMRLTNKRITHISARLKDCDGIEGWIAALEIIEHCPFLLGDNDRGWRLDIDFLMSESGFTKVMEGKYNGTKKQTRLERNMQGLAEWVDERREEEDRSGNTANY